MARGKPLMTLILQKDVVFSKSRRPWSLSLRAMRLKSSAWIKVKVRRNRIFHRIVAGRLG